MCHFCKAIIKKKSKLGFQPKQPSNCGNNFVKCIVSLMSPPIFHRVLHCMTIHLQHTHYRGCMQVCIPFSPQIQVDLTLDGGNCSESWHHVRMDLEKVEISEFLRQSPPFQPLGVERWGGCKETTLGMEWGRGQRERSGGRPCQRHPSFSYRYLECE